MKKPEELSLTYCGYKKPSNLHEYKFEVLGLKNLIKRAEERMSVLEQSSYLAEVTISDNSGMVYKEIFEDEKN